MEIDIYGGHCREHEEVHKLMKGQRRPHKYELSSGREKTKIDCVYICITTHSPVIAHSVLSR